MRTHPAMYTRDAQQQALGFLTHQLSIIEPVVYRTRYPDIQYPTLIPVDTSGNEWAKSVTFFSSDQFGQAEWFNHYAKDIPVADVSREKFERGVEMAAIGYRYSLEELGQAQLMPGTSLSADRALAAKRAYEEFVERRALYGDTLKGWAGLMNYPGITVTTVAADGVSGSTAFQDKTVDQIVRDFNAGLTGVYTESLTVEMANTVLLPIEVFTYLSTRQVPNTTMSVMKWLQDNNTYTQLTGQPLMIRGVRGLETAGVGGVARMILYRRDPEVLKLHIPMPHRFLPVWQTGPLVFDVPGIFRFGGVDIRRPKAFRYVDGIAEAPYE